jgi:hypothetical protein
MGNSSWEMGNPGLFRPIRTANCILRPVEDLKFGDCVFAKSIEVPMYLVLVSYNLLKTPLQLLYVN